MLLGEKPSKVLSGKALGHNCLYLRRDSPWEIILARSKRARMHASIGILGFFTSAAFLFVLLRITPLTEQAIVDHERHRLPFTPLWMNLLWLKLIVGLLILLVIGIIIGFCGYALKMLFLAPTIFVSHKDQAIHFQRSIFGWVKTNSVPFREIQEVVFREEGHFGFLELKLHTGRTRPIVRDIEPNFPELRFWYQRIHNILTGVVDSKTTYLDWIPDAYFSRTRILVTMTDYEGPLYY